MENTNESEDRAKMCRHWTEDID